MATFTVTTASDRVNAGDGVLSLREAVAQANATTAADRIVFAGGLEGKTLTLAGGELVLRQDVTIDGDANNDGVEVTLSGGHEQRILRTSGTGTGLILQDLEVSYGYVDDSARGAGIFVGSGTSLAMHGSAVIGCRNDYGNGGGIYAESGSRLTIVESRVAGNLAWYGSGGGIATGENVTLTIRDSQIWNNDSTPAGANIFMQGGRLTIERSRIDGGWAYAEGSRGGGLTLYDTDTVITRSSINDNTASSGAGIYAVGGYLTIDNSTIAGNSMHYSGSGGGILAYCPLIVRHSTITGNDIYGYGGGIRGFEIDIANSIVVGNHDYGRGGTDISGTIVRSNGHNLFGSDVPGNVAGDLENVAARDVFAPIDPHQGSGPATSSGIVRLRDSADNPALGGADPLSMGLVGQLGAVRPLPAGSLPDIGASETGQTLSTKPSANNDVLTGTTAAETIAGLAGADFIRGLDGNDTLRGGDGSDVLDGGSGSNELDGGAGIDFVSYANHTTGVQIFLEYGYGGIGGNDTYVSIEGAIGSNGDDILYGGANANFLLGGLGRDEFADAGGQDLYDFNAVAESKPGAAARDVISNFIHRVDKLDLMDIDADTTVAGNQAFRWVGTAALTGAGQLGYTVSGGDMIVRASNDADAASEFELQLRELRTLTAMDFYL